MAGSVPGGGEVRSLRPGRAAQGLGGVGNPRPENPYHPGRLGSGALGAASHAPLTGKSTSFGAIKGAKLGCRTTQFMETTVRGSRRRARKESGQPRLRATA